MTMDPHSSRNNKIRVILAWLLLSRDVASVQLIPYYFVHPGQRYANVTLEFVTPDFGGCNIYCVLPKSSPCYAFNYREADGSCQLVQHGNGSLVEADGYESYVQSE